MYAEYPKRVNIKRVSGFDTHIMETTGMMQMSLRAQRKWREEFAAEKKRIRERNAELASIHRIKKQEEKEARLEEFQRNNAEGERHSFLDDPVLYPLSNRSSSKETGIPKFQLIMRVDIQVFYNDVTCCLSILRAAAGLVEHWILIEVSTQGKFGKEKSVMAFQNTFGSLPERANLELTEMMFKSSSSRRGGGHHHHRTSKASRRWRRKMQLSQDDVKLTKEIFLPEPKIIQPYTRYMMHRADENSLDGFQKSGCQMQYYNRMMKVNG